MRTRCLSFLVIVIAAGLLVPGCKDWVDINNQDRDKILGQLDKSTTDLTTSIHSIEATFARERARLTLELQQTMALAIANLREVASQLDRSVDKMRVSITNFQQDTASTMGGAITRVQGTIARLENNLATGAASLIAATARELETQREELLKQTHQTVQSVIRPTMERLSREGDNLVGKVTLAANVVVVRIVTGILAAIALAGALLALVKLKTASQRWPAVAIMVVVLLAAGTSATVLAGPIARIGAPSYKISSGAKACASMSHVDASFRVAAPTGRPDPANSPNACELAMRLKDLAVECEVFAPTEALASQAKDAFIRASAFKGERVPCVTDDQCVSLGPGLRCDAVTGQCLTGICDRPNECPEGMQCVSRRCIPIDGLGGVCATPADCRPEQACDRAAGKCFIIASIPASPCEVEGQLGPCRQGVLGSVDRWVTCKQVGERTVEVCNGLDDDCDGTPDQGLVSADACIAAGSVGRCADGTKVCAGAAGWQCQPHAPQDEVAQGCNNRDDDCDGLVDDGVVLGGRCSAGVGGCADRATLQCINGAQICVPGNPVAEVCGNASDDDCDGATDGVDSDLAQVAETCNGFDDNCNGAVDDGQFCHPVKVVLRDVDDETYVWIGASSDPGNAVCFVRHRNGGAGECDLVQALRDRGMAPGRTTFTVMTVNSGCFATSAYAEVVTDRETRAVHQQSAQRAVHCGWVEADQFDVDFATGEVFAGTHSGCEWDGKCRPGWP